MKIIVDESAGFAVTKYLQDRGYDVLAVSEIMPQAHDNEILERAVREKRIIVTNDKDFGELVYRSGQNHHGVILLRLRNESAVNRVRVLKSVLDNHASQLPNAFTVATEGNIRIRR
ncbi:MAG: DUF5615 family PIN-like protein [Chloroflexota bacterium]|nr:DUF5615 family PIN-like protein [Chloroflexota bacterium]